MIWISSYHIQEAHTAWSPTCPTNDCFQEVAYGSDSYPRVLPHSWPCCDALQRPFGFFHFWDAIIAQHFKVLPLSLPENRVPQNPSNPKSIKIHQQNPMVETSFCPSETLQPWGKISPRAIPPSTPKDMVGRPGSEAPVLPQKVS